MKYGCESSVNCPTSTPNKGTDILYATSCNVVEVDRLFRKNITTSIFRCYDLFPKRFLISADYTSSCSRKLVLLTVNAIKTSNLISCSSPKWPLCLRFSDRPYSAENEIDQKRSSSSKVNLYITVVTVCSTCLNIQAVRILPTQCSFLTINTGYFPKGH